MNGFNLYEKTEGPYMGISAEATLHFKITKKDATLNITEEHTRTFRVLVYGAYNAYGLIGSECNGILVLDEDFKTVILDEHAKEDTGYFGPSERQLAEWERIVAMFDYKDFAAFVNVNPRAKYILKNAIGE